MSVCRLVRKWLSAHMLTNQIEALTSDLIVHLALNGSDCGSQVNGFYRTLHFIASKSTKLFVNFLVKLGVSSRWSIVPDSVLSSLGTTTIRS